MADQARVVIVGGGVMGASLAFHLAEAGCRDVQLLERNFIASGPTGYSSALVRQHYSIELYARMAYESFLFYRDFADRVAGGDCGFVRCGLAVAFGPDNADALRDAVRMQQTIGIETDLLAPERLRDLFGEIYTDDISAVAYERSTGYADPVATARSFAQAARDRGVGVVEGARAVEILRDGDRVAGVRTLTGSISCDTVVVAA